MKLLLLTINVNHPHVLQTYVGNMSYNLIKYCTEKGLDFVNDYTILEGLRKPDFDFIKTIDSLNVKQFTAIIILGLCTVDRFLPSDALTYLRSKMKTGAVLCQTSDYAKKNSLADITFSTKAVGEIERNVCVGWGADPDYYTSNQPVSPINILLDHTHYVKGEYDNTEWLIEEVKKLDVPYTFKRIGNSGKLLTIDDPVELYDRRGLDNKDYKKVLSETHLFFPTHRESVGLSVLEAGVSGCLVVSENGFIHEDRLNTVRHVKYKREVPLDWNYILSQVNVVKSRQIAQENSWEAVFNLMMSALCSPK